MHLNVGRVVNTAAAVLLPNPLLISRQAPLLHTSPLATLRPLFPWLRVYLAWSALARPPLCSAAANTSRSWLYGYPTAGSSRPSGANKTQRGEPPARAPPAVAELSPPQPAPQLLQSTDTQCLPVADHLLSCWPKAHCWRSACWPRLPLLPSPRHPSAVMATCQAGGRRRQCQTKCTTRSSGRCQCCATTPPSLSWQLAPRQSRQAHGTGTRAA